MAAVLNKLNIWTMDFLKKSTHEAKLITEKPKWIFNCSKCTGEWSMGDKEGIENVFNRPYVSCPHCGKKAKPSKA